MKRFLSLGLALLMLVALLPTFGALAEDTALSVTAPDGRVITVATADTDMSAAVAPENNPWSSFDTSEPVHLVFYVVGTEGEDQQKVIDLVNQRMKQLINTTIEVPVIPLSDFQTKYPLVLAGGTDCDIIMTHPYIGPFATQADNGAFMELSWDFLNQWMPETMKSQTAISWKQAMYKGKLFQIPRNESDYEQAYGVVVLKSLREKYNIPAIDSIDTFQQYLYAVADGEKDTGIFPMYANPTCPMTITFLNGPNNWQMVDNTVVWDADNAEFNPDDIFVSTLSDEYRAYCLRMADWSKHGVWPSNAITNVTHISDLFKDGKSASDICMYKAANEDIVKLAKQSIDAEYCNIMPATANTRVSPYNYDALAITSFCKNPERAALAIDVMKNDPLIDNLLQGGIEGDHYVLNADGTHSEGPSADLYPWSGWAWCLRSQLNPTPGGIVPEVAAIRAEYDAANIDPAHFPVDGFTFDNTGLEDVSANINALSQEWAASFDLGVFGDNTNAKLDEYIGLLKQAGIEQLLDACKLQLKAFLAQ
ncbi:MAG: ABC transporter substrate-binding protein [Eubacteriales bacterium]|nr:ABC transporter substrate-binding protein [Eubacteriales bacterium]